MTLSTVDEDGIPDARILIVKKITDNRWYFATSAESKKGMQLKKAISLDFLERSDDARAVAILAKQSKVLPQLKEVELALEKAKEQIQLQPELISPDWRLYAVLANEVEFWQADPKRKHTRVKYYCKRNQWEHCLLWP